GFCRAWSPSFDERDRSTPICRRRDAGRSTTSGAQVRCPLKGNGIRDQYGTIGGVVAAKAEISVWEVERACEGSRRAAGDRIGGARRTGGAGLVLPEQYPLPWAHGWCGQRHAGVARYTDTCIVEKDNGDVVTGHRTAARYRELAARDVVNTGAKSDVPVD